MQLSLKKDIIVPAFDLQCRLSQVSALKKQLAENLKEPEEYLKEADAAKKEQKGAPSTAPESKAQAEAKDTSGAEEAALVRSSSVDELWEVLKRTYLLSCVSEGSI